MELNNLQEETMERDVEYLLEVVIVLCTAESWAALEQLQ